ncbi:enoyl-CoA hydratase/isomerase family protein [Variovorax sp. J22R24]|uniref:enoyl-CoA hydratase/isomerase family protein n=1 Tax=Variovorax gracilis TaxID=3053502 RepID=UPI002577DCD0|nr:enoyl-CoA hydratase/isomerase family protein [Variovorax sp. J22R24]MDM0103443.1 enoyl-CoA hydratase/isomerase family protein [Variovorax sp. J22R24]
MPSDIIPLRESQLSIEDGVALFTHQRPAARNALSMELRADYRDMLTHVENDRSVRALVLTGSGGSFCAGGDLKAVKERQAGNDPEQRSADAMRRRLQSLHAWVERLRSLEVPVIAAVDGPAVGAGFSIALAADFILASTRAVFCMSFAKIGLIPDLGAFHFLPRAVGLPMAKELALTARRVGAAEGRQLGFVHALHEPETLLPEAMRFARRFIAGPREAMGLTKSLMNKSFETSYATLAELECNAQAVAADAPYHGAAVEAFLRGEPLAYDWDRTTG